MVPRGAPRRYPSRPRVETSAQTARAVALSLGDTWTVLTLRCTVCRLDRTSGASCTGLALEPTPAGRARVDHPRGDGALHPRIQGGVRWTEATDGAHRLCNQLTLCHRTGAPAARPPDTSAGGPGGGWCYPVGGSHRRSDTDSAQGAVHRCGGYGHGYTMRPTNAQGRHVVPREQE